MLETRQKAYERHSGAGKMVQISTEKEKRAGQEMKRTVDKLAVAGGKGGCRLIY
jgi:hypothetical protein